jgi:hypothetical protein
MQCNIHTNEGSSFAYDTSSRAVWVAIREDSETSKFRPEAVIFVDQAAGVRLAKAALFASLATLESADYALDASYYRRILREIDALENHLELDHEVTG